MLTDYELSKKELKEARATYDARVQQLVEHLEELFERCGNSLDELRAFKDVIPGDLPAEHTVRARVFAKIRHLEELESNEGLQQFWFNTGVTYGAGATYGQPGRTETHGEWQHWRQGTLQIEYWCADVPENAYATGKCWSPSEEELEKLPDGVMLIPIVKGGMKSTHAEFKWNMAADYWKEKRAGD